MIIDTKDVLPLFTLGKRTQIYKVVTSYQSVNKAQVLNIRETCLTFS